MNRIYSFLMTFACLLLLPLTSNALTLEQGLKIVVDKGRDVSIARSDEDAARAAVSLARSPWLPFGHITRYFFDIWCKSHPIAV